MSSRWILAVTTLLSAASVARAQPTITSLGSVSPSSVTSNVGGTWKALGSNLGTAAGAPNAAVSTLTGSDLTMTTVPGSEGGGLISANGRYAVVVITNSPPDQIFGNTASNVFPPFSTTPPLVPAAISASEFCAAVVKTSREICSLPFATVGTRSLRHLRRTEVASIPFLCQGVYNQLPFVVGGQAS